MGRNVGYFLVGTALLLLTGPTTVLNNASIEVVTGDEAKDIQDRNESNEQELAAEAKAKNARRERHEARQSNMVEMSEME